MQLGLDLASGCKLAITEMYGDWYRDPWGWPEYKWLRDSPQKIEVRGLLKKQGSAFTLALPCSFHPMEVPKNRLAVRPAVLQDSLSRLLFATAVASNISLLHRDLPEWV